MPACIQFEDDHLLVVKKPAGMNTHSPSPFAGEGVYDWLRHREPRWARLAIIHRLDKETSGLLIFSKSTLANRSLTEQFTQRTVKKRYCFLTDRPPPKAEVLARSSLVRAGDKYYSRKDAGEEGLAETIFRAGGVASPELAAIFPSAHWMEAEPRTGRTHQIRVHAAELGFPILGDVIYGGTTASRLFLHSAEIRIRHPFSGEEITFASPPEFAAQRSFGLRSAVIDPIETNAFRIYHGASDHRPGWYVDRFGDFLLAQSASSPTPNQLHELAALQNGTGAKGVSHKILSRRVRAVTTSESSPQLILGEAPPKQFVIRENSLKFEASFEEGYSVGLFLDQRDNRRRLLTKHVAADFPLFDQAGNGEPREALNTFAYTCSFSVCAARAGMRATSLDLSKKYLEWGRRNFELNDLDPRAHDFIFGDVFDWLGRFARKGRKFDLILLDPPTFSQSKKTGTFRAEKDYGRLVQLVVPLLKPAGVLFASTNAAEWAPEKFLEKIEAVLELGKRKILKRHYVPQPPDFPISTDEPAFLKTVWYRLS